MSKTTHNAAWGVEFGGSAVRQIRVTRTERGYHADGYAEVILADRWEEPPGPIEASAGLAGQRAAGPMAAAIGDELVMFRALSLPRAEPEAFEKMVRGQLEVLVPTQAEQFVSGWRARDEEGDPALQRVLLCAARREAVVSAQDACRRLGGDPQAVVPSILALATLWTRLHDPPAGPRVLVDVAARCTAVAVVDGGDVLGCAVMDHGADHWTERIAEQMDIPCPQAESRKHALADQADAPSLEQVLAEWARQLKEAYADCVAEIPRQRRPEACVLFGQSARMPGLAERAGRALGMEARPAEPTDRLDLAEGMDFARSAAAIGAAMCVMDTDTPAVSLTTPSGQTPRGIRSKTSRRWVAVIVWVLAAAIGMYQLDRIEANRLDEALHDARDKTSRRGSLERQLAIGRYLETRGPMPLDVLDRVCKQMPKKALLTSWRYSRNGDTADLVLAGTVPNEKEFLTMLEGLCQVGEVEWKNGRPDKNKFRFEVRLQIGRSAKTRAGMAKPSADEAKPAPAAASGPAPARASQPAGKPASSPATSPATSPSSHTQPGGSS